MPLKEPEYFASPESYNWLDAMSGDKSFIDPRTYEVHETAWMQYPARWSSRLARCNLAKLEGRSNNNFVQKWVQKTVSIKETVGYDPVPDFESEIEDAYSDLEDLAELKRMFPIQLEAVPPFPKQSQWGNSLFATHMQIHDNQLLHGCSSLQTSDSEPHTASQPYSETTSVVVSSLSKSQVIHDELNIGKLIMDKLRHSVVRGREAYRSLHGLMS
ncbi:uncharacterized protein N7503_004269 [Penicillium pulvis]|uniref:uncharacterized protein n=1 Tax=Penicillium pulvis TaxID=1562058 RepID=UPI002547BEAC|nr:uncharacterized protein N7503_004269 [Penicillium pulvis]KAJ5806667.1 hypothetical protein N7503_004269 [Penicillium pulvis]